MSSSGANRYSPFFAAVALAISSLVLLVPPTTGALYDAAALNATLKNWDKTFKNSTLKTIKWISDAKATEEALVSSAAKDIVAKENAYISWKNSLVNRNATSNEGLFCPKVSQCPANCASVSQCPAVVDLQERVEVLFETLPLVIAEVADIDFRLSSQQYQLFNQQNQINTATGSNPVIPYNQAACSATPFSYFNSTVGVWQAVDFKPNDPGTQACREGTPTATCAAVCAGLNLRCDPCATSRALSCIDPLFYALQQAGKSNRDIQFRVSLLSNVPPPPPNAYIGTGCASSFGPLTSATTIGGIQGVCGENLDPVIETSIWPDNQNFVDPSGPNYRLPSTACDVPLRGKTGGGLGSVAIVQVGTVCFCAP